MKTWTVAACIALFCFGTVRYWVFYDQADWIPPAPESFRLAHNIAEGGQFANPFVPLDTGPSAHLAPAFPALLALIIRLFGDGAMGVYVAKLVPALLLCLQLALFPFISKTLGMGGLNGFIAAVIWIAAKVGSVFIAGHQQVPMYPWDSFYVAFFLLIGIFCCRRYMEASGQQSKRIAWLIGLTLGVLMLTSPPAITVFGGWMIWAIWKSRQPRSSHLVWVLLLVLITAPWLVRNYRVFDRPVFVRDNFGLELSVSNNDCAMFGIQQNFDNGCFLENHPNVNIIEARKVLALGEPEYNALRSQQAFAWIRRHPAKFLNLCAMRFAAFWIPPAADGSFSLTAIGRRLERTVVYPMTALSIVGLVMLYRRDRLSAMMCMSCLGFYPLIYYLVQYEFRYRYPILWVTFLLGALPITKLAKNAQSVLNERSKKMLR
jgi:hypothetical protein